MEGVITGEEHNSLSPVVVVSTIALAGLFGLGLLYQLVLFLL